MYNKLRSLAVGAPLVSIAKIFRRNSHIRILNPDWIQEDGIDTGAYCRIHSKVNEGKYLVWICDPRTFVTIRVEVPLAMMGQLFVSRNHKIFSHFA